MNDKKNPVSFQLDVSDFLPADESEKQGLVVMRESANFWRDGMKRFRKNPIAMTSFVIIILVMIFAFIMPEFYPYTYQYQDRDSINVKPMEFSESELIRKAQGKDVKVSVNIPKGLNITNANINVEYDANDLEFVSGFSGPVVDGRAKIDENFKSEGAKRTISFTYDNAKNPITSDGGIVVFKFRAALDSTYGTKAPIKITKCDLTNDKGEVIKTSVKNGEIEILEKLENSPVEDIINEAPTNTDGVATIVVSSGQVQKGENLFPHFLGTDSLGRDYMIRIMMGSRISLLVGIIASAIILIIGSVYGSVAGYFGGRVDMVMMRLVDIIYTVPDILIIILLSVTLSEPLKMLAMSNPAFAWIDTVGVGLISIFIVFSLLYWVGMARIIRGQILTLKEQEYVTAARALGASNGRIIRKHLLTNCVGTLIVTTTLQIPSSIFTESFLSFLGLGVSAPMPSLGSLASDAINGITSFPHRLLAPAVMIILIILSFNLLGDGLRDAFDPKLKK